MAVLAGFVAINPASLSLGGLILAVAVGCWTAGFDIVYAILDVDFDRQHHIYSLPARIGVPNALVVSRILHLISVSGFALAGYMLGLGIIFTIGVILTGIMLIYEHTLIKPNDLSRVNLDFFTVNGIISVLLASSGLMDILILKKG